MTQWIYTDKSDSPAAFNVLTQVIFLNESKDPEVHICYYNAEDNNYYFAQSAGDNRKPISVNSIGGQVIRWALVPEVA